jgi:hypothetical protein
MKPETDCGFAEQGRGKQKIRSPNFGCVVIAKRSLASYTGRRDGCSSGSDGKLALPLFERDADGVSRGARFS